LDAVTLGIAERSEAAVRIARRIDIDRLARFPQLSDDRVEVFDTAA